MKQWDIVRYPYPSELQPHYFVVISNDSLCSNPQVIGLNGLVCATVNPINRPRKANEVYINGADGMNHKTLVKCDFIHTLWKAAVIGLPIGRLSPARIIEVRRRFAEFF